MWVVPEIRGTILGAPITRITVFGGLYWGPLILGKYHVQNQKLCKSVEPLGPTTLDVLSHSEELPEPSGELREYNPYIICI